MQVPIVFFSRLDLWFWSLVWQKGSEDWDMIDKEKKWQQGLDKFVDFPVLITNVVDLIQASEVGKKVSLGWSSLSAD